MKRTLTMTVLSVIGMLWGINAQAQKLKDKNIKLYAVSIPSEKLPDDFLTYSVKCSGSGAGQAGKSNVGIAEGIKMDGFRRIEPDGQNFGHLRILMSTGYVRTDQAQRKTRTSTTKNKDGSEKTTRYYWYEYPMSISSSFKIVDPSGTVLDSGLGGYRGTKKGKEYTSLKACIDNYGNQLTQKRREAAGEAVNDIVSGVRKVLGDKYDFRKQYTWQNVYFIKKHDAEEGFTKAFELTKKFFENAENICMSSADALKELEAPIEFWKRYDDPKYKSDKKEKKLYQAANYNLALIYAQLDEYDLARKHANNVIKSEGKDKRSSNLITATRDIESRLDKQGLTSRRYCRDVANAAGPAEVTAFELEKEEMEASTSSIDGSITLDGNAVAGSFVQNGEGDLTFGPKGNTKFKVEENSKFTEYELTDEKISEFKLGDRHFVKRQFAPSAKGAGEAKLCILEEVYTSDKITLYQYCPTGGELSDDAVEFAFAKASDEMPISLLATQFLLWKKGMAKYFNDCTDLSEMCAAGEVELKREDLIKAARIYSELCE